jgi:hypothetical protein
MLGDNWRVSRLSNAIISLRRQGLSSIPLVSSVVLVKIAQRLKLTSPATAPLVASAALRTRNWKLAVKQFNLLSNKKLSGRKLHNQVFALNKNSEWDSALRLTDEIQLTDKYAFRLALLRIEALWKLERRDEIAEVQKLAVSLLQNPSPATISLITWKNNLVDLYSRYELLQETQGRLDNIRKIAGHFKTSSTTEDQAYVFWNTGFKTAPKIIQTCVDQMREIYGDQLVTIDSTSLESLIKLPKTLDRVYKLWPANFSDILRVALLAQNGGLWLDATIYTTENSLSKKDSYLPSGFFTLNFGTPRIASWFMLSKKGNYQTRMLYAAMLDYWQHNRHLSRYFLLYDLFEVLFHLDSEFRTGVEDTPVINAKLGRVVQKELLFHEYNESKFKAALKGLPIQKLTYKPAGQPHGPETLFGRLSKR